MTDFFDRLVNEPLFVMGLSMMAGGDPANALTAMAQQKKMQSEQAALQQNQAAWDNYTAQNPSAGKYNGTPYEIGMRLQTADRLANPPLDYQINPKTGDAISINKKTGEIRVVPVGGQPIQPPMPSQQAAPYQPVQSAPVGNIDQYAIESGQPNEAFSTPPPPFLQQEGARNMDTALTAEMQRQGVAPPDPAALAQAAQMRSGLPPQFPEYIPDTQGGQPLPPQTGGYTPIPIAPPAGLNTAASQVFTEEAIKANAKTAQKVAADQAEKMQAAKEALRVLKSVRARSAELGDDATGAILGSDKTQTLQRAVPATQEAQKKRDLYLKRQKSLGSLFLKARYGTAQLSDADRADAMALVPDTQYDKATREQMLNDLEQELIGAAGGTPYTPPSQTKTVKWDDLP